MADDSEAMTELAVAQYVLSSALEYRSEPLVAQEDAWARPERRGARWPIRPWRPPGGRDRASPRAHHHGHKHEIIEWC